MTERTLTLRRSSFGLIAVLAMMCAACSDDDPGEGGGGSPDAGVEPPPPGEQALLRVVHAAPDAPGLDVYLQGADEPVIEDLSYREASAYAELEPGSRQLALRPADAAADTEPIFVTQPIELIEDERTTAVAAGFLGEGEEQAFRVIAFEESFADPGVGRAMVRVLHFSPDLENIAVDVVPGEGTEVEELGRFGDTAAGGIPVPAGEPLRVEVSALAEWTFRAGIFTLPPLPEGGEVFIIALGRQTDGNMRAPDAFSLLVIGADDEGELIRQDPVLHAIHGIPDAPAVNVSIGDQGQIWNLGFGALSRGLAVSPGAHEVTFTPTEGGEAIGAGATAELQRARRYLVVGAGFASPEEDEPGLRVVTAVDDFALETAEDAAQVKVVHGIADGAPLDVSTLEGRQLTAPPLVSDLGFGEASAPFEVPVGVTQIGAAPVGTIWPSLRIGLPSAESSRLFAVLVGALDPSWDERFLEQVIVDASGGSFSEVTE